MMRMFICEDNAEQRRQVETIVRNYVLAEDLDMELALSTDNPDKVLQYLTEHNNVTGLYFLDVDLGHSMTGIALAAKIRELDDEGKIVFVTTHGELSFLTFTYKVEAMDYIVKDAPEGIGRRIRECIDVANSRHMSERHSRKKRFKLKTGDRIRSINYEDIMFFETSPSPHKLILHTDNAQFEFYGSIKELEEQHECLYRCHKSYVVNKNNIKHIDRARREIEMVNEETLLISVRALRTLVADNTQESPETSRF